MKKIILSSLALGVLMLTSCGETEVKYALNGEETSMNWTGKYVADGHTHTGTIDITEGNVVYKGEEFVSGEFTIDMKTIKATDVDGEMKMKLEGHLNSADYFNTASNTKATVVINEITDKEIKATIKLLGKELKADMPVKISKDEKGMTASGKFEVDFAALNLNGFKPMPGDPEVAHPDTKIAFDLNLVLKK